MKRIYLVSCIMLSLAITLIMSVSCQTSDTPSTSSTRYFAHLDVRYLAPSQELRGQAIFTEGDSMTTAQPLAVPGGASFLGSGMRSKTLFDDRLRYESILTTSYLDSLSFRYRITEDTPWETSTLYMSPIDSFHIITASKQNGISVDISGEVDLSERLVLLFTDPNGEARTVVRLGPLSDKTIFIPADGLQHFIPGDYSLYLVKIKEGKFEQGDWLVSQHIEYYTAAQDFTL